MDTLINKPLAEKIIEEPHLSFLFPQKTNQYSNNQHSQYNEKILNNFVTAGYYEMLKKTYQLMTTEKNIIKGLLENQVPVMQAYHIALQKIFPIDKIKELFIFEAEAYDFKFLKNEVKSDNRWSNRDCDIKREIFDRFIVNKIKHTYSNYDVLRVLYKSVHGQLGFINLNNHVLAGINDIHRHLERAVENKRERTPELKIFRQLVQEIINEQMPELNGKYKILKLSHDQHSPPEVVLEIKNEWDGKIGKVLGQEMTKVFSITMLPTFKKMK